MHALLGALASILLVAGLATAGDDKKEHPAQTSKMAECNAQAGDKKLAGDARKQFMSECLKSHPAASGDASGTAKASAPHKSTEGGHNVQGEKMKTCNQEAGAKNLHGDERRQFMSQCLKAEKKS